MIKYIVYILNLFTFLFFIYINKSFYRNNLKNFDLLITTIWQQKLNLFLGSKFSMEHIMNDLRTTLSNRMKDNIIKYYKSKINLSHKDKLALEYLNFYFTVYKNIKEKSIEEQELYVVEILKKLYLKLQNNDLYEKFKNFNKKKFKIFKILQIKSQNKYNIIKVLRIVLNSEYKIYRKLIYKKYYNSLSKNDIKKRNQQYIENAKKKLGITNYYIKCRQNYKNWYRSLSTDKRKNLIMKKNSYKKRF